MRLNFSTHEKNGVPGVPGVLPCNHAGFSGTLEKIAGVPSVLEELLAELSVCGIPLTDKKTGDAVVAGTPGTPVKICGVPRKPAPILKEHHGIPGTPEKTSNPFDAELFEERAAVIEHEGCLSRDEAERLARAEQARCGVSNWWRLRFPSGAVREHFIPSGDTRESILMAHPGAVDPEPFELAQTPQAAP